MRVKLWGTRGTVPMPTAAAARYGGNTPCVEVRADDGERLILDAGIGLHWLGRELHDSGFVDAGGQAHLLLTHTHWGHIQGIPFFTPMLEGACHFRLYGDGGDEPGGLAQLLRQQMNQAYCPVPNFLEDRVGAHLEIIDLDEQPFELGTTRVTPRRVHHIPGAPCLGFRLDNARGSLAYIPDVEYPDDDARLPALELAEGVDLLIHDAHFTAEEYRACSGQGHCTDADAVSIAREAGARRLLLFHHHPDRDDRALDVLVSDHHAGSIDVEAAAQGAEYVLDGR